MSQPAKPKSRTRATAKARSDKDLCRSARKGDREAYIELFVRHLPALDRFVRREIVYYESIGAMEVGLVDHRAVIDQTYLAALENLSRAPAQVSFRGLVRQLALRILRQQSRIEHEEEPAGLTLEGVLGGDGTLDTDLWEFYQPDDIVSVEDTVGDGRMADPARWLEMQETEQEFEAKINNLPVDLREAFVLRVIEGLPCDEIAAMKKKPPQVIRQAVHDARQALREAGVESPV